MKKKFLQGTIKRHPDGFGFFIPDNPEHPDVYVPRHSMNGIMTLDKVMVEVSPEPGGDRFRGEVMRVVSRGNKSVIGSLQMADAGIGLIRDEGKGWGQDLKIKQNNLNSAKKGDLVVVEITTYPENGNTDFYGKVTQVIGSSLDPLTDVKRVLFNNKIPQEFSAETLKEAKSIKESVPESDVKGRKDLRHLNFITIDGATARDFDDAIYIETRETGFQLWVAIADVSHYVRPHSGIDRDAYERGTSVYFPNFVVPMLPEALSNGLCSLNPKVTRLALVAEMKFNFTGDKQSAEFYEAAIESKARVTYGEAQEVVDGAVVEKLSHVKEEILRAADLAKILMAKRFREGSLDLEIPEVQMVLDGSGNPVDLIKSERLFAHRLIEEMMLAANVAVAEHFQEKDIPGIYRVHASPNEEMISLLEKYLSNFGGKTRLEGGKLQKKLTKALQEFDGKPESQVLNILTLRSMSQAKYSHENIGHFGLGFQNYTHFTSPIRRYPDLIVHRVLKSIVMPGKGYNSIQEDELATSGTLLSACEQRAVKAERQFQAIKKARFMQKHIGEEFEGTISSVTKFGIFVLLRAFEVDGLIRLENLSQEKLVFDEENMWLVGAKSGFKYSIGDVVKIRVANADSDVGQVDFELADRPASKPKLGVDRKDRFGRDGKSRGRVDFNSKRKEDKTGRGGESRPEKRRGDRRNIDTDRRAGSKDREREKPSEIEGKITKPFKIGFKSKNTARREAAEKEFGKDFSRGAGRSSDKSSNRETRSEDGRKPPTKNTEGKYSPAKKSDSSKDSGPPKKKTSKDFFKRFRKKSSKGTSK
jgi:ribonuclease R